MKKLGCSSHCSKIKVFHGVDSSLILALLVISSSVSAFPTTSKEELRQLFNQPPPLEGPSGLSNLIEEPQEGERPSSDDDHHPQYYDDYYEGAYDYYDDAPEVEARSPSMGRAGRGMDLDSFLDQFYLIKTPHGYILGRAELPEAGAPFSVMNNAAYGGPNNHYDELTLRERRLPANGNNFQLRIKKSDQEQVEKKGLQLRSNRPNFQLRVRKSEEGHKLPTRSSFQLRVRKDAEKRSGAFQLRVRKAGRLGNGRFQLRVRKAAAAARPQAFQLRVRKSPSFQLRVRKDRGAHKANGFQLRV